MSISDKMDPIIDWKEWAKKFYEYIKSSLSAKILILYVIGANILLLYVPGNQLSFFFEEAVLVLILSEMYILWHGRELYKRLFTYTPYTLKSMLYNVGLFLLFGYLMEAASYYSIGLALDFMFFAIAALLVTLLSVAVVTIDVIKKLDKG